MMSYSVTMRRTKKISISVVVSAFVMALLPFASVNAVGPSTLDFTQLASEYSTKLGVTITTPYPGNPVSYDPDSDRSEFWLDFVTTGAVNKLYRINSVSINGVSGLEFESGTRVIGADGAGSYGISFASAPGDYSQNLTNALISIQITALVPSTFVSTVTGMPSGISINQNRGPDYWDSTRDTTCMNFDVVNSSNKNYTLRFHGTLSHNTDSRSVAGYDYLYIAKHSTKTLYPSIECLPGDLTFNSTISISGTLQETTSSKFVSKKVKLPKNFVVSNTVEDVYYDPSTKKSSIVLRVTAPWSKTGVLRGTGLKLNGKKIKGSVVSGGWKNFIENNSTYIIYFKDLAGDYRSGKTLTFVGKFQLEKFTALNQNSYTASELKTDTSFYIIDPVYWTYDAKRKVTKVTALFWNNSGTSATFNLSQLKLATKVKKKGKFKNVTISAKFTSKAVASSTDYNPGWSGTAFEIPGDVRSNGKAIKVTGSITSN